MAVGQKRKAPIDDNEPTTKQIASLATKSRSSNSTDEGVVRSKKRRTHEVSNTKISSESQKIQSPPNGSKRSATVKPDVPAANCGLKRRRDVEEKTTPQNKRYQDILPISPAETPTHGARNLFDKLDLASRRGLATPSKKGNTLRTPPLTPRSDRDATPMPSVEALPEAAQDLVGMFTAFVNATSIYMAHQGANAPADLSELLSLITNSWKKRKVLQEDVQRMLALLSKDQCPFTLFDDGQGRVSLEQTTASGALLCLNAHALIEKFQSRLCSTWQRWSANPRHEQDDGAGFVRSLSLASIDRSEYAVDSTKPSKGQDRLNRFKRGIEARVEEEEKLKKPTVAATQKTTQAVVNRGSNLLDRIMAKQQLNSLRPSGPTKEELDRKSALDRVEDVARVMELLAGGRPRVSFSLQMMIQHLQNSLRNPIARDEVERCLELMAAEIMPSFVTMIKSGSVRGVVVTKGGKLGITELRKRLESAGA